MIRIKDYIFPEENILYIRQRTENIINVLRKKPNEYDKFKDELEIKATFEDIEWNYGNTDLEELKLDYSAVVTGYKKLEEENKELVETNYDLATKKAKLEEENKKLKFAMQDTSDSANDTCGELQQRINKALEYIKEKSIICDKWVEVEPLQFMPVGRIDYKSLNKKNVEELLIILKGKEK